MMAKDESDIEEGEILFRESDDICEERRKSEGEGLISLFMMFLGMIIFALPFALFFWIDLNPVCGSSVLIIALWSFGVVLKDVTSFEYLFVTSEGISPPRTGLDRHLKKRIPKYLPFHDIIEITLNPATVPFHHTQEFSFEYDTLIEKVHRLRGGLGRGRLCGG